MALPKFYNQIQELAQRLEDIPAQFQTKVASSEKQILDGVLELLTQMDMADGKFVTSVANLERSQAIITQLRGVMVQSDFTEAVATFAQQFDVQGDLSQEYFKKAFSVEAPPEIVSTLIQTAKRNAVDLLINRAADSEFLYPLRDIIEQSIVNNAPYSDTLKAIRQFVTGDAQEKSRLMRYSSQIARDTFAISDASVNSAYAEEVQAEWFYYSGGLIATSRPFCVERADNYFHKGEIARWGLGRKTLLNGSMTKWPNAKGEWGGKILGTTMSTIQSYRGGYNCGHTLIAVGVLDPPITRIKEVIAQGLWEPSKKEAEVLGLTGETPKLPDNPKQPPTPAAPPRSTTSRGYVPIKGKQEFISRMESMGIKTEVKSSVLDADLNAVLETAETLNAQQKLTFKKLTIKSTGKDVGGYFDRANNEIALNIKTTRERGYAPTVPFEKRIQKVQNNITKYENDYLGKPGYDQKKVVKQIRAMKLEVYELQQKIKAGEVPLPWTIASDLKNVDERIKAVFIHEVGHSYHFNLIGEGKLYPTPTLMKTKRVSFPSDYAKQDYMEWFTEWYTRYKVLGKKGVPEDLLQIFKDYNI